MNTRLNIDFRNQNNACLEEKDEFLGKFWLEDSFLNVKEIVLTRCVVRDSRLFDIDHPPEWVLVGRLIIRFR